MLLKDDATCKVQREEFEYAEVLQSCPLLDLDPVKLQIFLRLLLVVKLDAVKCAGCGWLSIFFPLSCLFVAGSYGLSFE